MKKRELNGQGTEVAKRNIYKEKIRL